jgi:glycosyltransferase involved in cell wall biosynthesis
VIIGDGPRRTHLERLAAELGLGESVQFLGSQAPDTVAEWMRRASALAVPSVTAADGDAEGLPVVLFEAAASGLPVVGSDHSGIPEGVEEGKSGFIVAEGEPEPLARRLIELLATPELAARMRVAARRLAEREFDIVHQTAKLERLYDRARERA